MFMDNELYNSAETGEATPSSVTDLYDDADIEELEKQAFGEDDVDISGYSEEQQKTINTLSNCLVAMTNEAHVGVFLMEVILRNGGTDKKEQEVQSRISVTCKPKIEFANGDVRLKLMFENNADMDLRHFSYMWDEYWKRNTEAFLHPKPNIELHFNFEIQCTGIIEGKTYMMTFLNPLFGCMEKDGMVFTVSQERVSFGEMDIDYRKTDREIEYETRTGEYADKPE